MYILDSLSVLLVPPAGRQPKPEALSNIAGAVVERLAEDVAFGGGAAVAGQSAGGLSEEELGSRVERHAKEEVLQVDSRAVGRDQLDKLADMTLEHVQVCDLGAREVGSQHRPGVFPVAAIIGEDSVAEELTEASFAAWRQLVVVELYGQHCLDVLRFTSRYYCNC